MKNFYPAFIALLLPVMASAQLSISGKVTDQQTGLPLPRATVSIASPVTGTATDSSGNYHFSNLKKGWYTLKVSYIGYQTVTKNLDLEADLVSNVSLAASTLQANVVTVNGTRAEEKLANHFY